MKKHIQSMGLVLCALLAFAPLSLNAAPVLRSGKVVDVSETQEVPNDFYAVASDIVVSGKVTGDLYAAGGTVTVKGEITEDIVVVGGIVHVEGPVGDDIRVVGGELVISGAVEGDVLVAGGVVKVLPTARIGGDLLFVGGDVIMEGDLRGSLSGDANTVRINGPVLGAVSVTNVRSLELGDQAHVEGTITYSSPTALARLPGSVVSGDVVRKELLSTSNLTVSSLIPILTVLFTTLAFLLICKRKIELLMRHSTQRIGRNGLIGLAVMILVPILSVVLMASLIGFMVGLTLLFAYILLLVVAISLVGIFIGALLAHYFEGEASVSLKWALIGTFASLVILFIPYIGAPLLTVASLVIIGSISRLFYARVR